MMKRRLALLTALLLVLGCVRGFETPAVAQDISGWKGPSGSYRTADWPEPFREGAAVVRSADGTGTACLYRDPDTAGGILFVYYDGVQMEIVSTGEDGWTHVQLGTMEGFMRNADLAFDRESVPKSLIPQLVINPGDPVIGRSVTVPTAPLRIEPDSRARTIASYAKGVPALLLGYCDGWCQITVKEKTGFMETKYLQADPSAASYQASGSVQDDYTPFDPGDYVDVVPEAGYDPGYSYPDPSYYWMPPVSYGTGEWTVDDPYYNAAVYNPNPKDHLNLRDEPDETSLSLGKYFNGTRVIVHYVEEEIGWALVTIGTITGYMKAIYLEFGPEYEYPPSAMPLMYLYNPNSSITSLLEMPTQSARAVGQYQNGAPVTVMGYSSGWLHVIINGTMGFLPTAYAASVYNPSPIPDTFSWNGPTGVHSVADWPLAPTSFVVNNPNPRDRLNLRTSPSSTAGSQGKYYNGVQVTPLEFLGSGWIKVRIGSLTGYMDSVYISTGYVASAMPVLTTTSQVNLRSGMSTKSKALDSLPKGTQVILMGFTSQWAHVIVDGQTGFIFAKYLK